MKTILSVTGLSILLVITGFFTWELFFQFSMDQLEGVKIQVTEINSEIRLKWMFSVALGIVPWLCFGVLKTLALKDNKQVFFAAASIVISGIIFWQYKLYSLKTRYEEISSVPSPFPVEYRFALENLNLEVYLFFGFLLGAIIGAIALYRSSKRQF